MLAARARRRPTGTAIALFNCTQRLRRTSVSGRDNFYLHEKLRPDKLWNDKEHRRRPPLAEKARSDLAIRGNIFSAFQILSHLDRVSDLHVGPLQHLDNMLPGEFGLARYVVGQVSGIRQPRGA